MVAARPTWARLRVHASHATHACFDALLVFVLVHLFRMRTPAICVQHAGHACTHMPVF
jgi:hypothetical protein